MTDEELYWKASLWLWSNYVAYNYEEQKWNKGEQK
jgi:hypothetical protein